MPLTKEILEKYNNNAVFVETGTGIGDAVHLAQVVGFKEIYSIEKHKKIYYIGRKRFWAYSKVRLFYGDSSCELGGIIGNIDSGITFWLDAHEENTSPLLEELKAISRHPIKEHTILIDDVGRLDNYGISISEARELLKLINPKYQVIEHKTGSSTILIASIK